MQRRENIPNWQSLFGWLFRPKLLFIPFVTLLLLSVLPQASRHAIHPPALIEELVMEDEGVGVTAVPETAILPTDRIYAQANQASSPPNIHASDMPVNYHDSWTSTPLSTLPQVGEQHSTALSPYITDLTLPDGAHTLAISSVPTHYATDDGSFLPIDATFQKVEGGFINQANLLKISAGEHSAVLRLLSGETAVGWEPQALVMTADDGSETSLAHILDPETAVSGQLLEDGRVIHYKNSWSLAGLHEELVVDPGQVEQSLIFNQPLQLSAAVNDIAGQDKKLSFQATLHLLPGAYVYAESQRQTTAFTTEGAVEIHDSAGNVALTLDPVIAYEQADPSQNMQGRYHLTPQDEGSWLVSVETPWAWWTEPTRTYPVVLDPTMKVLSTDWGLEIWSTYPNECRAVDEILDPVTDSHMLSIAPDDGSPLGCGEIRSLLRFNDLPVLPPGYEIEQVELLVAPTRMFWSNNPYMAVQVRQATSDWHAGTTWQTRPSIDEANPLDGSKDLFFTHQPGQPADRFYVTRWTLQAGPTGFVTNWLEGTEPNYGLELRSVEEPPAGTSPTMFIPGTPNWDEFAPIHLDPVNSPPTQSNKGGGGFMLMITYTPPTLPLDSPQVIDDLPSGGGNFADTFHTYLPPSSSSAWTAVASKGIDEQIDGNQTTLKSTGNLALFKSCQDTSFGSDCITGAASSEFVGQPDYFLIRGNPANYDVTANIAPPDFDDPDNANLDKYLIEAVPSVNLPNVPPLLPNTMITRSVTMSTSHVMKLFNLDLPENVRVGVQVFATAVHPIEGNDQPMPFIEARVFEPNTPGSYAHTKDFNGWPLGGHLESGTAMGKFTVDAGKAGTWALALDYFGDVHPTFLDPVVITQTPIEIDLKIKLVVCPLDAIPSDQGCVILKKPSASTDFRDVGPFRVFSEAGFDCIVGSYCHTLMRSGPAEPLYAPYIVWKADWVSCWPGCPPSTPTDRLLAVVGSRISFDATDPSLHTNGNTWLVKCVPGSEPDVLEISWQGTMRGHPEITNPGDPQYGRLLSSEYTVFASLPLNPDDNDNVQVAINVQTQQAEVAASIKRAVLTQPATPLETFTFDLAWKVRAEGYSQMTDVALAPVSTPAEANVASLTVIFGPAWDMDYRDDAAKPNGRFTTIRNHPAKPASGFVGAKIVNPPDLGSAWKGITAVILTPKEKLAGQLTPCPGQCLDLRGIDDAPGQPNRTWELPDVIVDGQAQTVMFSRPGELTVFSTDHPNSQNAAAVPFSFRTFDGEVEVDIAVCPVGESTEKVAIIRGKSTIALPGLGSDTGAGPMLEADFILCETALRQVGLSYTGPPEIPVGSTPILVNSVQGNVIIGPDNTNIILEHVGFHDASNILTGAARVEIDTEGLFDIQARGTVLAEINYLGHAWVAWNPLDVGVDVTADYRSFLYGHVNAHVWKGQGWQNKYHWLADDGRTHLTGSIVAQIKIKKGQAFKFLLTDVPPFTISFSITVAFGEFCANANCSVQEWGVKGAFEVLTFNVGFFYGFDSGFAFILGSDGHILIDQYGSRAARYRQNMAGIPDALSSLTDKRAWSPEPAIPRINGQTANLQRISVPDPLAPTITQPITVTAVTDSFLALLNWAHGAPQLSLLRPDGQQITVANAASYGVEVHSSPLDTMMGVANPMPGVWQAQIDNITGEDDYHFAYFANKKTPDVALLTPATTVNLPVNTTSFDIEWTVPPAPPPDVDLRISLYYTGTNITTAITTTHQVGGVIRENLPLADGLHSWDLSSLAEGDYQVYARIYSGQPGDEALQPMPTMTGTNQLPWDVWTTALGIIHITDNMAPDPPPEPLLLAKHDGLEACWPHNSEKDLSGYLVRSLAQNAVGVPVERTLRIAAVKHEPYTFWQCARIVGLNDGLDAFVDVAAYDASGNLSGDSPDAYLNLPVGEPPHVPDPGELRGILLPSYQVELTWPGAFGLPPESGYWVYYAQGGPAGPERLGIGATEGSSPIYAGNVTELIVNGLPPGYLYYFAAQTHDDLGRLSTVSNQVRLLLSDGADADNDGMADDWEAAYGVVDPTVDLDGDGLTNVEEYGLLTDPQLPDSDFDGFSDGMEAVGNSDPLDSRYTPATPENYASGLLPLPRLELDTDSLTFAAYETGPNPPVQTVMISNTGGNVLTPTVSTNAPWLLVEIVDDVMTVAVDKTGLGAGYHTGQVTVAGALGSMTQDSPQQVVVHLWLLSGEGCLVSTDVTASRNNGVQINWPPGTLYNVFRAVEAPYSNDGSQIGWQVSNGWVYNETLLGNPAQNAYYVVGVSSSCGKRLGAFDFAIVPGD